MKEEIANIIIDLDSILDTRLTMLTILSEKTANEVIVNGKYDRRLRDNFGNISSTIFHSFYKNRNKHILKYSLPTGIFQVLNELIIDYNTDSINVDNNSKLYINTYPYKLTKQETITIEATILGLVKGIDIEVVYMHPCYDLTPAWVTDNVKTIIKYDGLEWLELHNRMYNTINSPMLNKTLIVPALVSGTIPNNLKLNSSFFHTIAASMKSLIEVLFIDVKYFSTVLKK